MNGALVVGGSGFVGGYLCDALAKAGVFVRATYRSQMPATVGATEWLQIADLATKPPPIDVFRSCSTVFHLAGHAHAWTELASEDVHRKVTVEGTRNLLAAARAAGVQRLVFFSSVKAGGEGGEAGRHAGASTTPYGRARREAEELVLAERRESGMHVCNLRLSMVYGACMKGNLPRMILAIDRGRFPPVPDTANKRSMVSVDDVVQAALLAAERPQANGKTYVLTDGEAYSTRRIYVAIHRALGKRLPHWSVPFSVLKALAAVGDTVGNIRKRRFVFDSEALDKLLGSAWYDGSAIERDLGYRPRVRLEDALAGIIDSIRAQRLGHER